MTADASGAMTFTQWMVVLCAASCLFAVVGVVINRWVLGRGFGARAIQFIGASTVVPGIIALAMLDKLDGTTAALFGAFIGYLFSNISKFDDRT